MNCWGGEYKHSEHNSIILWREKKAVESLNEWQWANAEVIKLNEKCFDHHKVENWSLFSTINVKREMCKWVQLWSKIICLYL